MKRFAALFLVCVTAACGSSDETGDPTDPAAVDTPTTAKTDQTPKDQKQSAGTDIPVPAKPVINIRPNCPNGCRHSSSSSGF